MCNLNPVETLSSQCLVFFGAIPFWLFLECLKVCICRKCNMVHIIAVISRRRWQYSLWDNIGSVQSSIRTVLFYSRLISITCYFRRESKLLSSFLPVIEQNIVLVLVLCWICDYLPSYYHSLTHARGKWKKVLGMYQGIIMWAVKFFCSIRFH